MQSVHIANNAVSSNPAPGEVYSMQHYVTKYVSDLRQVGSFLRVLRFSPPIKLTAMINSNSIGSGGKYHNPNQNL
jgi:hypothetical protein